MSAEDYQNEDDLAMGYCGVFVPCEVVLETPRARLVEQNGKRAWFPKSLTGVTRYGGGHALSMPSWLLSKNAPDWAWDSP